jgi:plasmid stabilization system protein ParE
VKLVVSAAAQSDLVRLQAFLRDKNPAAAQRAVAVLDAGMRSLDTFPQRGLLCGAPGVRELIVPFGHSAYVLRYALLPLTDEIVILRIWHGREGQRE